METREKEARVVARCVDMGLDKSKVPDDCVYLGVPRRDCPCSHGHIAANLNKTKITCFKINTSKIV